MRVRQSFQFATLALVTTIVLLASGCATSKDVAYIQSVDKELKVASSGLQNTKIQPKDLIGMLVSSTNPEAVAPFNGMLWAPNQDYMNVSSTQRSYLVDNDGMVNLPVIGLIKVSELTIREAETAIKGAVGKYVSDPSLTVTVNLNNFRYSVLGEVKNPGRFTAENGKVNIFEALANAGDLTMYGKRDQVRILREDASGNKEIVTLDLRKPDVISSPYYYLRQGDVIYVVPNDAIASSSTISAGTTIWISVASLGFSLVNILLTVLR